MARSEFNLKATDLSPLMTKAIGIAGKAGKIINRHYEAYKEDANSIDIEIKGDESPVTNADKEASIYIVGKLKDIYPGIPVISEENKEDGADSDLYWAVDPLDGTKEFLNKTGGFSVKIALIHKGEPIIGVVYCPAHDTMYFTHRNCASYKSSPEQLSHRISTKPALKKGELTTLFNLTHADPALYADQRKRFKGQLNLPKKPDNTPGLPRNLQVAEGLADTHIGTGDDPTLKEGGGFIWDTAPDFLLLKNAGGLPLLDLTTGKPLRYDRGRKRMPSYIAIGDKKLGKKLFP